MASAIPYVAAPFTGGASLLLGQKNLLKTPTPPEAVKPATPDSKPVQQAVAEATQRRSKARGFFSTILSQLGTASQQANAPVKSTFGS